MGAYPYFLLFTPDLGSSTQRREAVHAPVKTSLNSVHNILCFVTDKVYDAICAYAHSIVRIDGAALSSNNSHKDDEAVLWELGNARKNKPRNNIHLAIFIVFLFCSESGRIELCAAGTLHVVCAYR